MLLNFLHSVLTHRLNKTSLRTVLIVPFVVQIVGAVGWVGYLSYRHGQMVVEDLANRLIESSSERTIQKLEDYLSVPHVINQINADAIQSNYIPGFKAQNPLVLEHYFWQQIQHFESIDTIAIANEEGGMIGSGQLEDGTIVTYSTPNFQAGDFTGYYLSASGDRVRSQLVAPDYDARQRPWYRSPAIAKKAVWSDVYEYISDRPRLGISAGLPLYDAKGNLQGVLATDILLSQLDLFLSNLQINRPGEIFIVEPDGFLIATSRQNVVVNPLPNRASALIKAQNSADPVIQKASQEILKRFGGI
jgi:hypothetical protein